jgi:hypothetical protein
VFHCPRRTIAPFAKVRKLPAAFVKRGIAQIRDSTGVRPRGPPEVASRKKIPWAVAGWDNDTLPRGREIREDTDGIIREKSEQAKGLMRDLNSDHFGRESNTTVGDPDSVRQGYDRTFGSVKGGSGLSS